MKNCNDAIAYVLYGCRVVKRVSGEVFWGGVIQVYEGDCKDVYATGVRIVLLYGGDGMNW